MARYKFDEVFEQHFVATCASAASMAQAALVLHMNYKTLCHHARRLGCFKSNAPGRGITKRSERKIPISAIFDGSHPTMQSHKLKVRLLKEGYKPHRCEQCALESWLDVPIPLELHHADGDRYNNALGNLRLLCPDCHALTSTYRAKNIKKLSARSEKAGAEPLKIGETFQPQADGNPEPSPASI